MVVVAPKILETAQSPNSSFPFLFNFGLGVGLVKILVSKLGLALIHTLNLVLHWKGLMITSKLPTIQQTH